MPAEEEGLPMPAEEEGSLPMPAEEEGLPMPAEEGSLPRWRSGNEAMESMRLELDASDRGLALKLLKGTRQLMEQKVAKRPRAGSVLGGRRRQGAVGGAEHPDDEPEGVAQELSGGASPRRQREPSVARRHARSVAKAQHGTAHATEAERPEGKVRHVCAELIETERKYLSDMRLLQTHFASKLEPTLAKTLVPNLASFVMLSGT